MGSTVNKRVQFTLPVFLLFPTVGGALARNGVVVPWHHRGSLSCGLVLEENSSLTAARGRHIRHIHLELRIFVNEIDLGRIAPTTVLDWSLETCHHSWFNYR